MFPPDYFATGWGSLRPDSGLLVYRHVDGTRVVLASAAHPTTQGLQLWLRADAISGVVDGEALGSWPDVSGQDRNATQQTALSRPTLRALALNGRPAVRFNGVNSFLDGPSGTWRTFFAVVRCDPNPVEHMSLWGSALGPPSIRRLGFGPTYAHSNANDFAQPSAHRIDGLATNQVANERWHIVVCRSDVAQVFPYRLGGLGGAGNHRRWVGEVAEMLVYDTALPIADQQRVEQYLGVKYGLPAAR